MIYRLLRPLVFQGDPERAHDLAMASLERLAPVLARTGSPLPVRDPRLEQRLLGLSFPSPLGLAAGFDKSARALAAWPALGFGFAEIGTVTPASQPGNPRPRLFRLPADDALLNRMGFNNDGAERVAERLARWRGAARGPRTPVGVNLGASAAGAREGGEADYLAAFERLWPAADYFVVNVSSPNTPGLRRLQERGPLEAILRTLAAANARRAVGAGTRPRPLLVKIAPDLEPAQVDELVDLALEHRLDGMVLANTTTSRDGLVSPERLLSEAGGVSGRPLRERSTALLRRAFNRGGGRLTLVGVGGVFDAEDAWQKLLAGASLVQLYTALVYEGPTVIRRINLGLLERMERAGARSLAEVVGSEAGRRAEG
ncbi:MAG: dihydroorotate dehydrogenase [Miltoncostaeaceae bacterium]|nr:dihydroorotate dehydrogenase [Miltoncostaeaceae bacterium]